MSTKWKKFDEGIIAKILSSLGDGPKHFNEIFLEMNAQKTIGSKTTLSQYLKHLFDENRVKKITSTDKGKRIAYELVSDEDRQQAEQANVRRSSLDISESIFPTQNPLNPKSIEVIKENYRPDPKPTPSKFLSEKVTGIVCAILEELQIQLEIYEEIIKSSQPQTDRVWIESSFNRLELMLRERLSTIALFQNAEHYTHDELVKAVKSLHREYLDKLIDMRT